MVQRLIDSLRRRPGLWALAFILVPTLVRLWFVSTSQLGLVQDEAQYWDWTRTPQLTYYSKGPLIAWTIWLGTWVAGNTELGVRLATILMAAALPAVLWWLVAGLWKRPVLGALAVFLTCVFPLFAALGIMATTDNPFVLCWALAMAALYAATTPAENGKSRGAWPHLLLVAALAVGVLAKYTMLAFTAYAGVYLFLLWRARRLPAGVVPRLAGAVALGLALGFLPTLVWNIQNDFVSYKHVAHLVGVSGEASQKPFRLTRVPEYLGAMLGFAQPWWFILACVAGWKALVRCWSVFRHGRDVEPLRADAGQALTTQQNVLLGVFFWPLTAFLFFWSLHAQVLANWNAMSFVPAALLAATGLERALFRPSAPKARTWAVAGMSVSVALLAFIHVHQLLPLPPGLNPANKLKGWREIGQRVDEVAREQFADRSRVFFLSEVYDITAALSFYVPGQQRAYCLWTTHRRMNQYDMWPGPQDKKGWDAVFVTRTDTQWAPPGLKDMFESVEGPYRHVAVVRGQPVRSFPYFLCRGYNGTWPRHETGAF